MSLFSLLLMERETKDKKHLGKIKLISIQGLDTFVNIPEMVLNPAVKASLKTWLEGLTKYYTKNHKNI